MKQLFFLYGWVRGWSWVAVIVGLIVWLLLGEPVGVAFGYCLGTLFVIFLIGIPVAAVLTIMGRLKEVGMRNCPYCAEPVKDEAIVCKHCGRDIPSALE